MSIIQDIDSISIGPLWLQVVSEELGGCYNLGCLNSGRMLVPRAMREIRCSVLEAPAGYFPMQPGFGIALSSKELSAINFALGWGPGASLVTGSGIDTMVGNPAAASSVADPAEWHIVKLTGAAPWAFTLYTENRYLDRVGATFAKAIDIDFYTAANNNGDTNVAGALWTVSPVAAHADGLVTVSDACSGKLSFSAITDASVSQWTYDASAAPFTINGTYPIIERNVQSGDTVALIGVAYKWGRVLDAAGTAIPAASQQALLLGNDINSSVTPVSLRGVHMLSNKSKRRAIMFEMWKGTNMSGFNTGFDSLSANDISLDFTYMAQDDARNHSTSPLGWVRFINSTTDLDPQRLLIAA